MRAKIHPDPRQVQDEGGSPRAHPGPHHGPPDPIPVEGPWVPTRCHVPRDPRELRRGGSRPSRRPWHPPRWVCSRRNLQRKLLLPQRLARPRWVCFAASPRPLAGRRILDRRRDHGDRRGRWMRTMTGPRRRAEARAAPRTGTGGQPPWSVQGEPRAPGAPGGSSAPPASARACGSSGPDSGARAPPRPSRRTTPGGAGRPGCPAPPPRAGPAAA